MKYGNTMETINHSEGVYNKERKTHNQITRVGDSHFPNIFAFIRTIVQIWNKYESEKVWFAETQNPVKITQMKNIVNNSLAKQLFLYTE